MTEGAAVPRVACARSGHRHVHRHCEAAKPPKPSGVHGREAPALDGFPRARHGVPTITALRSGRMILKRASRISEKTTHRHDIGGARRADPNAWRG
jgi:hypothetical protein